MLSEECCKIAPVHSDYLPQGATLSLPELDLYVTGSLDSKLALVVVYDIFGFTPNIKQVSDKFADLGFYVVIPDFFHGKPVTPELRQDRDKMLEWIGRVGAWEVVKPEMDLVKNHLREKGFKGIGVIGLCWGGLIAARATGENSEDYIGASLIHPSRVEVSYAEDAKVPWLLLPAKTDPDMLPHFEALKKKPFAEKCEHYRFEDVQHGFLGARGDFNDRINVERAMEAIQKTSRFFKGLSAGKDKQVDSFEGKSKVTCF